METTSASVLAAICPVIFSTPFVAAFAQKLNMIIRRKISRDRMA